MRKQLFQIATMNLMVISERAIFFLTLVSLCLLFKNAQSQLVNNGGSIIISGGAILYTDQSLVNSSNGTITNNGSIITDSNIVNNPGSSITGNGIYNLQGNFSNTGTFKAGTSTLNFSGSRNSTIKNAGGTIYKLQLNKDAGKNVSLLDNEKILNSVIFSADNNWIYLNAKTLTLANTCTVLNYSSKRYFVTNGTGSLKKESVTITAFTFPVGFNIKTYNPLTITEKGTTDNYSVRCLEHAYINGGSGDTIASKGINVSWLVSEATSGGANATIQLQWNVADELSSFTRNRCMVSRYNGSAWDFNGTLTDTAKGSPRTISRNGLPAMGYFTVLSQKPVTSTIFITSNKNHVKPLNYLTVTPVKYGSSGRIDLEPNTKWLY